MKVNWWMWYRFSAKMIIAHRCATKIQFSSGAEIQAMNISISLVIYSIGNIGTFNLYWRCEEKKTARAEKKWQIRKSEHEGGRIALYTWQIYAWNAFNQSQYLLKLLRPGFRMWGYIQIYFTMTSMLDKKKYGNPWQSLCWIFGMHTFVGDLASLFFFIIIQQILVIRMLTRVDPTKSMWL